MTTPVVRADDPTGTGLDRVIDAHREARAFYRDHLQRADGPRRYLASRGLGALTRPDQPSTREIDAPWHLGYAPPGWTNLIDHLTATGYTPTEQIAAGLATTTTRTSRIVDLFRDRIMFPIHDPHGNPIAFLGRAAPTAGPEVPKYLNTPGTIAYHKGQTLYGRGEQADRVVAGAAPVLVEGPVDVLAVWLAHPDASRIAVAPCGTGLTAHHATTIAAMPGTTRHGVTAALDNDDAGRKATVRAWQLLSAHPGLSLYAASLPDSTDPGDLITSSTNVAVLRAALTEHARPLIQAVIDIRLDQLTTRHPDLLHWTQGRVHAARALAALITELPVDQIGPLTSYIAQRTDTGYDAVAHAIIDHLERPPPVRLNHASAAAIDRNRRPRAFPPPGAPASARTARPRPAADHPQPRRSR